MRKSALILAAAILANPALAIQSRSPEEIREGKGIQNRIAHLPDFPPKTNYQDARPRLMALGWLPVKMPNAQRTAKALERCGTYPEFELYALAGTNESGPPDMACTYAWRRGDTLIEVWFQDIPDLPAERYFDRAECLAGCDR
jgi:hypothetical protein